MVPFHDKVTIFLSGGNICILRRREQMMLIQPNVMSHPIYYLFRNNSNKKVQILSLPNKIECDTNICNNSSTSCDAIAIRRWSQP